MRVPNPGTAAERQVMAAAQPGFLESSSAGIQRARDASVADGRGNHAHAAVRHWGRFTVLGLRVPMRRPLDPLVASLDRKLSEVDLVDAYAWWLVEHVGVNTETAWGYVCTVNAWHDRAYGVGLAGNFSLQRVKGMLDGYQRLQRAPVVRRLRYGVRPRDLRAGIDAALQPRRDALHANVAACMEVALVAIARMGELAASRGRFDASTQPSRADVDFRWERGRLVGVTIHIVNIKARGAERFRRLPVRLPLTGGFLSPGLALWYLCCVVDPVPAAQAAATPLFRNPATGDVLSVSYMRDALRQCLRAIGRDPSLYGAHSCRIGGATAMGWLGAPPERIMAAGRWRSDAYLLYVRESPGQALSYAAAVAGADTDDSQPAFLDVDAYDFDDTDLE